MLYFGGDLYGSKTVMNNKHDFLMGWNNAITQSPDDCPYMADTIAHQSWWRGWNAAIDEALESFTDIPWS